MARRAASARPGAAAVRDELLCHVEDALKTLRVRAVTDERIHTARKHLKRARANLRLLRDAVGKAAYVRENAALRDAARPLSSVRDAKVLIETLDALLQTTSSPARRRLLFKARTAWGQALREARAELGMMNAVTHSTTALTAALQRMREWRLENVEASLLDEAYERLYRKSRRAYDIARGDGTPEALHEWRKQVKYLEQSTRACAPRSRHRVKALLKAAGRLADLLGEDHDLVVLKARLETLDAAERSRPAIARTIAARRRALQRKALKRGAALFSTKPGAILRELTS
jgi:CHAD domain-containing protein